MPPRFNIPPLTRSCLLSTIGLSVLYGTIRYNQLINRPSGDTTPPDAYTIPFLTIVPGLSIVYPWVFVLASFVETNIFNLAITLSTLFYGGKYLERAWGSAEFGKFLLVVSLVPNFVAFTLFNLWFVLTGSTFFAFRTVCGGIALQASFLVAFKQLVPEHTVTIFRGVVKIRVKHFPAIFLLINLISWPIFRTDVSMVLAFLGFFTSWTYLRFFKTSYPDLGSAESPQIKGDASETFSLANFFPDPIQRPVAIISDAVYNILITLKICTPFSAEDISASNSRHNTAGGDVGLSSIFISGGGPSGGRGIGGSTRAEAERRRAMALKALDQRLHAVSSKAATTPPTQAAATTVNAGSSNNGANALGETKFDPHN
ncbi:eukaryotic integral membrane protein-domain-containing protein [Kalaharituber pfeilii]|nr:eukaryotic integral membrane protein-domain-containing protein [Kalaharituber pfeilii]